MDASVTWEKDLEFVGIADSGFPVRMSSSSGSERGAGPVELTIMALAGCTAMDVISILLKKQQRVEVFRVEVHAERASSYPKVVTSAQLKYMIQGHDVAEAAVRRAIELSVERYCPVHAMLSRAFPIALEYSILEGSRQETGRLVREGLFAVTGDAQGGEKD